MLHREEFWLETLKDVCDGGLEQPFCRGHGFRFGIYNSFCFNRAEALQSFRISH